MRALPKENAYGDDVVAVILVMMMEMVAMMVWMWLLMLVTMRTMILIIMVLVIISHPLSRIILAWDIQNSWRSSIEFSTCVAFLLFWQCACARNHDDDHDCPQAINYSYPTTNTPPLTTYHALIVCCALRCMCACDDDRDAKEDDCDSDVSTSDQFSWKQLRKATVLVLRWQKPSTNAMNGLYLLCVNRMLEARWVEGCAESLPRHICVWRKSCWRLPFTHDGVGFHPTGRWRYIGYLYQGGAILNPLPLPSALRITHNGPIYMFI